MRTDNRFLVLCTLGGLVTVASCTLITDVDRTKITDDAGVPEGGQGASGGTGGTTGGSGGKGGTTGGSSGSSQGGQGGEAGDGATGGTGGSGGTTGGTGGTTAGSSGKGGTGGATGGTGGTAGMSGDGGEAGADPVCGNASVDSGEACDDGNQNACGTCSSNCSAARTIPTSADGALVINPATFFADGDTFTLNDGTNSPTTFELECDPIADCAGDPNAAAGVASGNVAVAFGAANFDGTTDGEEFRDLIITAIQGVATGLDTAASDAGLSTPTVALSDVTAVSETVGNPGFVATVRCGAGVGCATGADCLSGDCDSGSCN
jgi:hypothetical protein